MELKIPPHSVEFEQSVLGGLLMTGSANDGSAFDIVSNILSESDFYRQDHRLIYRAMLALQAGKQPIDVLTVEHWLNQQNEINNAGGFVYLATMAKNTPSVANIKAYAEIVREKSARRQLLAVAAEMGDSVHLNPTVKSEDLLKVAEDKLFRLSESMRTKQSVVVTMNSGVRTVIETMDDLMKTCSDDQLLGTTTGFSDLDDILSGLVPGDLIVLAARPSMGKTSLAGDFELAAADKAHKPVLTFSLEMPTAQLVMRHMSRKASVPLKKIRKAWQMNESDWAKVGSVVKPLADLPIYMVNQPGISPSEIRAIARKVHRDCLEKHGQGLGLITVDYLQLMQADLGSAENRTNEVGGFSRALKTLALELNVPVVALSQLNRNLESRPNKRPIMSDLRDSGAVEQDADVVIFIYRDEIYRPDSSDKGVAEIIIAKQRNGEIGTVRLCFQGEYTRFANYSPDVYPAGYR